MTPSLRSLSCIVLAGAALGCGVAVAQSTMPSITASGPGIPFWRFQQFQTLSRGAHLPAMQMVIKDAETFNRLWAQMYGSAFPPDQQQPLPAPPAIDFSREVVIVASLGQKPTGGYDIQIERVIPTTNGNVEVIVTTISPGPNCIVTAVLTNPVDIIRMDAPMKPVQFVERSMQYDCRETQ